MAKFASSMSSSPLHSRSRSNLLDPVTDRSPAEAMSYLDEEDGIELTRMKVSSSPKPIQIALPSPKILSRRLQTLVLSLWVILCLKIIKDSASRIDPALRNKMFQETFLYFNPLLMLAMMIWLWGVNLWGFSQFRVNYAKVFDFDQNHLTHKEIWQIATWITILMLTSLTAYLHLSSNGDIAFAASQPVIMYCAIPLLLALPFDILYSSSRFFFLNTLLRLALPLQPITFSDFFLADVLTSMSKVLSDIERSVCRMYHGQAASFEPDAICGSHSIWIPCVLGLPYLFRFWQCLRQYSDTKDKSCLFNALKYATAFPVVFLSALKYHVILEMWDYIYRPLWLLSSVINSCYSFYWDISRDWDFSFFSGNYKGKNSLLRSNLMYSPRWVYYWAIGSNLLLRCAWTYKLSAHLRHNYLTVFTFSGLEMLRRFQWIFLRVENEHNKILLRSSSFVKEIETVDERLLSSPSDHIV